MENSTKSIPGSLPSSSISHELLDSTWNMDPGIQNHSAAIKKIEGHTDQNKKRFDAYEKVITDQFNYQYFG